MYTRIAKFPQDKYSFQLYDNINKLTWQQIQQKTGCVALCNLWYFHLWDYTHQAAVMLEGKWARTPEYDWPGICIDKNGQATTGGTAEAAWDYAASVQADYIDGVRTNTTYWNTDGVTYTGLTAQGDVVILLSPEDTPMDSTEAVQAMLDAGCVDILRWDGSWSSQGSLGPGMDVQPSQTRICRGWLLVFERDKEDKPVSKPVICIDPGHWPGSVNCAPDKSYWEYEFTWDLYTRLRPLLEKQGFTVVGTRTEQENPSLTARATVSNKAGADLFLSLHSNAVSGGWGDARGFVAYTSSGLDTAERNKAATAILGAVKDAGVILFGTGKPYHELFTVLTATTAPAVLLECGFHTNRDEVALLKTADYRDKLAKAIASGVMNYFGIEEQQPESWQPDQADPWAQEAWDKAVAAGIFDGTRPREGLTRQEAAVVLGRLNLL